MLTHLAPQVRHKIHHVGRGTHGLARHVSRLFGGMVQSCARPDDADRHRHLILQLQVKERPRHLLRNDFAMFGFPGLLHSKDDDRIWPTMEYYLLGGQWSLQGARHPENVPNLRIRLFLYFCGIVDHIPANVIVNISCYNVNLFRQVCYFFSVTFLREAMISAAASAAAIPLLNWSSLLRAANCSTHNRQHLNEDRNVFRQVYLAQSSNALVHNDIEVVRFALHDCPKADEGVVVPLYAQ